MRPFLRLYLILYTALAFALFFLIYVSFFAAGAFINMGVSLLFAFTILVFASRFIVPVFLRRYHSSIKIMKKALSEGDVWTNTEYLLEDFLPLLEELQNLLEGKTATTKKATDRKKNIERILNSMEEGLILLDTDYKILLANTKGLQIFDVEKAKRTRNFLQMYRNETFRKAIKNLTEESKRTQIELKRPNKVYQITITVVQGGYAIFAKDVTILNALDKSQREFAVNVSHALKAPLASISEFAGLIDKSAAENSVKEYSDKIHKEVRRLTKLVEDILKLGEIEEIPKNINRLNLKETAEEQSP